MTITITIQEMFIRGDIFSIIVMAVIFALMVVMLRKLGKGIDAKFAAEKPAVPPIASAAAAQNDAVTAAISAAVNEYRKK